MFEANAPRTTQAFEQRIRSDIEAIPVNMSREVMQIFQFRLQELIRCNVGHLGERSL